MLRFASLPSSSLLRPPAIRTCGRGAPENRSSSRWGLLCGHPFPFSTPLRFRVITVCHHEQQQSTLHVAAGELAACPLTASIASTCGCFTACLCPILLQLALADPGLAPTGLQGFFIQRETFIVQKSALFSSQTSECVRGWMP
jgi:hypothetical protein